MQCNYARINQSSVILLGYFTIEKLTQYQCYQPNKFHGTESRTKKETAVKPDRINFHAMTSQLQLSTGLYQGWPTSQMLRATFFSVFQQRAISYSRDIDCISITIPLPLIDTCTYCLARLVVYRPVSSVGNNIANGAEGLGFNPWAVKADSVATAVMFARGENFDFFTRLLAQLQLLRLFSQQSDY